MTFKTLLFPILYSTIVHSREASRGLRPSSITHKVADELHEKSSIVGNKNNEPFPEVPPIMFKFAPTKEARLLSSITCDSFSVPFTPTDDNIDFVLALMDLNITRMEHMVCSIDKWDSTFVTKIADIQPLLNNPPTTPLFPALVFSTENFFMAFEQLKAAEATFGSFSSWATHGVNFHQGTYKFNKDNILVVFKNYKDLNSEYTDAFLPMETWDLTNIDFQQFEDYVFTTKVFETAFDHIEVAQEVFGPFDQWNVANVKPSDFSTLDYKFNNENFVVAFENIKKAEDIFGSFKDWYIDYLVDPATFQSIEFNKENFVVALEYYDSCQDQDKFGPVEHWNINNIDSTELEDYAFSNNDVFKTAFDHIVPAQVVFGPFDQWNVARVDTTQLNEYEFNDDNFMMAFENIEKAQDVFGSFGDWSLTQVDVAIFENIEFNKENFVVALEHYDPDYSGYDNYFGPIEDWNINNIDSTELKDYPFSNAVFKTAFDQVEAAQVVFGPFDQWNIAMVDKTQLNDYEFNDDNFVVAFENIEKSQDVFGLFGDWSLTNVDPLIVENIEINKENFVVALEHYYNADGTSEDSYFWPIEEWDIDNIDSVELESYVFGNAVFKVAFDHIAVMQKAFGSFSQWNIDNLMVDEFNNGQYQFSDENYPVAVANREKAVEVFGDVSTWDLSAVDLSLWVDEFELGSSTEASMVRRLFR